jgi:heme-degrading monooxygenase HmoA
MHARISTFQFQGPPDQLDEGLRYARENIVPPLRQMDGFKGVIALLDRQSGKTLSVTLWESEQAMRASEEDANQLRQESAEASSETVEGVERYEVGIFEVET